MIMPSTATDLLEQILGRDGSPRSASTLLREQQDPAVQLGAAAARYRDALYLAAEHLARPEVVANLDQSADRVLNGLTREPAWPTLRGQLLQLIAASANPVTEQLSAFATRHLTSADDQAVVIDLRLQDVNEVAGRRPLP
jgi:hypothetical protein